ncbi:MAG: DUF4041 domain-containing protein [Firmicutes bacterium]|nr:DUF4041 domain-containing protein [Bacillota bacterium]
MDIQKQSYVTLETKYNEVEVELKNTQQDYQNLQSLITPEMKEAITLQNELNRLKNEIERQKVKLKTETAIKQKELNELDNKIATLNTEIKEKKKQIAYLDDELLVQEFGLYKPKFDFANALGYKESLTEIRNKQKILIKEKRAVTGNNEWRVNGSIIQGRKMINDIQKLSLRAFNQECDELIRKVKYTNFNASLDRLSKSSLEISKLGADMNVFIANEYIQSKKEELRLAFEYQVKKQEEKEAVKAAKAEQREQAKIQKELEERRRKVEKEQTHYQTAYEKLKAQIEQNPDNADLLQKQQEMEATLSDIDKALTDIDYRQANMRAGYVYIISNIGSFGKDIYKIGMTRRLEPQDRIDELGGASVPFNFDVHAMIFSDDAPSLETALHKAFEDKKVNMVNHRREFFHVTLDEIKEVIKKNFDKTVEFIDIPDAEQYRVSEKMRNCEN